MKSKSSKANWILSIPLIWVTTTLILNDTIPTRYQCLRFLLNRVSDDIKQAECQDRQSENNDHPTGGHGAEARDETA